MSVEAPLNGRVALVTGASRGIGAAVARHLARSGVRVAVGYHHRREAAEALCRALAEEGRRAVAVGGDVADPRALEALVQATEQALGPVDIVVSNAGSVQSRSLEELDLADWDRTLNEHLRAAFLLARLTVPGMRERGWGRIVLMSSVAAFTGGLVGPHYTTAKAGLIGLTHALAPALAPHGITVNAVAPALIETPALDALGEASTLARRIPVGRLGHVDEVAHMVMSLLNNAYVTGQTVSVDGGLHPR